MINVGIIGVSGYSGRTALEYLLNHPEVRVTYVSANNTTGKITEIWPKLNARTNLYCSKFDLKEAVSAADLFFLAVPHTTAMAIAPKLLRNGKMVIDLSGDYRLKTGSSYKQWYGTQHKDLKNLNKAVYGLPELYREDIKKAAFIANPGCYPTAAILGLAPLIATHSGDVQSITIDAKSGITGSGRKANLSLNYSELNENFKAYKILNHQHTPEIELYLSNISKDKVSVDFVPHLLPMDRGIFETIYVRLNSKFNIKSLHTIYKRFYKIEPFVRVLDQEVQPELKNVAHTNYCDIGLQLSKNKQLLVITSAIDNLSKGAAGQAIQNMNIMNGFKETEGLL